MSATVLRFNNRSTRKPGAPVQLNASALDQAPEGSTGTVLLLGTALGGVPYSAQEADDITGFTDEEPLRAAFISGDLKEAGVMAFNPAKDTRVSGADRVITLKVNPDTQSAAVVSNANGAALNLLSRDYGIPANQVSFAQGPGTSAGKKVTVSYNGVSQVHDNIGGTAMFSLQYRSPPSTGWGTMTASVTSAGVQANGTRLELGHSTDLVSTPLNLPVRVISSNNADIGQVVTVYCLVGGIPTARKVVLNGTTLVVDSVAVDANAVYGAVLSAACVGTITISQATGPITLFTIAPAALSAGGIRGQAMFVNGGLTMVTAASTASVLFAGVDVTGAVVLETKALNNATPVTTTTLNWARIDFIGLALVSNGQTVTFSAVAAKSLHTVQDTLVKLRDLFNGLQVVISSVVYGFTGTINTTRSTYAPANLDLTASPINAYYTALAGLTADLALMAEALTSDDTWLTATVAGGATGGAPTDTSSPIYLSGGTAVGPTNTDWLNALNLSRDVECDTVVLLTADPNIHALASDNANFMAGPGEGERDFFVGIMNAGLNGLASFTEIRTQISAINNRNIRVCAQEIDRFSTLGVVQTFPSYFLAAVLAGAQAGMKLGRSLTDKTVNVLKARQHSSWTPKDNGEDALLYGLVYLERMKRRGWTVVRDVTSAVGSDNPVFTDGAANRIVNFVTRETRRAVRQYLGEPGAPSLTGLVGEVKRKLTGYQNDDKILKGFKNLVGTSVLDRSPISFDVSPVFATNFIPISINLYDQPVTG